MRHHVSTELVAQRPTKVRAKHGIKGICGEASMGMSTHRFALCVHYPTCQGGFAPWTPGLTAPFV